MEGEVFRGTMIAQGNDGTAYVNDFGFMDSSSGSGHVDTGIAAGDLQTMMQAAIAAVLTDDVSIVRWRFACTYGPSKGEVGYVDVSGSVAGDWVSGGRMPNEIAASYKRNTGHAGRGDRGRIFVGPVPLGLVENANEYSVDVAAVTTLRDKLKANLTTQTRVLKPVLIKPDGSSNGRPILNVSVAKVFVHRRTRRPRVGA